MCHRLRLLFGGTNVTEKKCFQRLSLLIFSRCSSAWVNFFCWSHTQHIYVVILSGYALWWLKTLLYIIWMRVSLQENCFFCWFVRQVIAKESQNKNTIRKIGKKALHLFKCMNNIQEDVWVLWVVIVCSIHINRIASFNVYV